MRFDIMKNALLWFGFVIFLSAAAVDTTFYSEISDDEYKKLQEIASFLQKRVEEIDTVKETADFDLPAENSKDSTKNGGVPPFDYSFADQSSPVAEDSSVFAVGPNDPRYYQDFDSNLTQSSGGAEVEKPSVREEVKKTEGGEENDEASEESGVRQVHVTGLTDEEEKTDIYFTAIVAGCSAAAVISIIVIGISCYRLQKNAKAAANVDYPAYGVTGPNKDISPSSGDRRLAQSAQMYHYQHQKQQIIAMENMGNKERRGSISDAESEDDNEEGDYTVYECPGLAPTGEMEVKNPLFHDDSGAGHNAANVDEAEPKKESQELPK